MPYSINSQEPELFFFGPLEPELEPLEKKYQELELEPLGKKLGAGAGASLKKSQEPELLRNLPASQLRKNAYIFSI